MSSTEVDLTKFKVGVESDDIGMGDCHSLTSSESHSPIIPLPMPNGNRTGKLRVRLYPRVGSPGSYPYQ